MERMYRDAAKVLRKLEGKQGSLKSLVFASENTCSQKKKLFALASQTIKHKPLIAKVIEDCNLLEKEPCLSRHLCLVLVYDLLFGKGVQCGGAMKQSLSRHKNDLKTTLAQLNMECFTDLPVLLPKYARVNRLKSTVEEVISLLVAEGYTLVDRTEFLQLYKSCISESRKVPSLSAECEISSDVNTCTHNVFCQDFVLEDLFMFCPFASLTSSPMYINSQLILQDKASCLPAFLLSPPSGSHVIDTCAAPGNKTTQLASIMNNVGSVHAFDKDQGRFKTLREMVIKSGSTCVTPHLQDFLQVVPSDYPCVKYMLVDPSCSGSGIVGRLEYNSEVPDKHRLKSLSRFQKHILKHALSFPSVERVVYSTCSVHLEENERVVEDALSHFQGEYDLVHALPSWERRGDPSFSKGVCCIRANAEDLTNGFFVAVFERKLKTKLISTTEHEHHPQDNQPVVKVTQNVNDNKLLRQTNKHGVKRKKRQRKSKHYPVTGR